MNITLLAALLAALFGPLAGTQKAAAQAGGESWTLPVNLSRSGAAGQPQLVVSADGVLHVLWVDAFSGFTYSHDHGAAAASNDAPGANSNGSEWTQPVVVTTPFVGYMPVLVASPNGRIHAFWVDKDGVLYHSQVNSDSFANAKSWQAPKRLADSVVTASGTGGAIPTGGAPAVSAEVGADGRVHLGFIQPIDLPNAPAGLYYLRSDPTGASWTAPKPLYTSPYFRSIKPEDAHLKISVSSAPAAEAGAAPASVYMAWDNPARERVYFARSNDGGENWEQPVEVDAPQGGTLASGPSQIMVKGSDPNVLLLWQTDNSGARCTQYYQWSFDQGATWQTRQRMLEGIPGCPDDNRVLVSPSGQILLLTSIEKQVYLLAWNGSEWSAPQLQGPLNSFVDNETFKPVQFSCRQPALTPSASGVGTLFVVGCDAGNGKDIWITSRQIVDVLPWFAQDTPWGAPAVISSGPVPLLPPVLIADSVGRLHAFWSQAGSVGRSGIVTSGPGTSINYARREGGQWSVAPSILASPEGISEDPAVIADGGDNLFAVWSGGQAGQPYFSKGSASRGTISTAWSTPMALPAPVPAGASPEITIDSQGMLYVAYALPLNEQRGVYITRSADQGATWSEPVRVFDAAAAGWAMVDDPHIAIGAGGEVHLIWVRYSVPGGAGAMGMFYARSNDGGTSWSQAATVSDKAVVWSRMLVTGQSIHRVWEEISGGRSALWHERSNDGGATWSRIAPVTIFGDIVGLPALAKDNQGRLYLFQAVNRNTSGFAGQSYALQSWMYDGNTWVSSQGLELGDLISSNLRDLTAAVTSDGSVAVAFNGQGGSTTSTVPLDSLFVAIRNANTGEGQPQVPGQTTPAPNQPAATQPAAAPTEQAPAVTEAPPTQALPTEAQPTAAATQSAAAVASLEGAGGTTGGSSSTGGGVNVEPPNPLSQNAWLGPMIGLVVAGVIVLVVFVLGARGSHPRRR